MTRAADLTLCNECIEYFAGRATVVVYTHWAGSITHKLCPPCAEKLRADVAVNGRWTGSTLTEFVVTP